MTRWWIIDCRQSENLRRFSEWLGKLNRRGLSDQPEHLLLFGCDPQMVVDVRKSFVASGSETQIHALFSRMLDAFDKAPDHWLQLCLQRLLQKNEATSVEIHPASIPDKSGLDPDQLLHFHHHPERLACQKKPALAFVSPLPPSQTGIAVYSDALLQHLGVYYDLTLVVEKQPPRLSGSIQALPWLTADAFARRAADFDRIVYQVGNSLYHAWQFDLIQLHPGLVVLHDYYLYDAVWWQEKAGIKPRALRRSLYDNHGWSALLELETSDEGRGPEHYPVNGEIVNEAAGLVVHSQHALALHHHWYPDNRGKNVDVIPHLRELPEKIDRAGARRTLDINDETLVIASFGNINPKKGADRIVNAFLNGGFDPSLDMLLVFAGSGHAGEFGNAIYRTLRTHPRGNRVRITGYLSDEQYRTWLQASDIAVQLRTVTRGESSGAVLDVMSHGLPLITNAHGSNAELPGHAVYMLPEDHSEELLQKALVEMAASPVMRMEMGRKAQSWIRTHHDPDTVAALYHVCIEKNRAHPAMQQKQWFDRFAAGTENHCLTHGQLKNISASMQQLQVLNQARQPRLLIDVSILAWHDQKTGIERVTREMAIQLLKNPPHGFRSELIRWQGNDFYLAADYAAKLLNLADPPAPSRPVEACADDIYLSLEWAPPLLLQAADVFLQMKAIGVRFCFTVHDLLPLFLPRCFPEGTKEKMNDWFHRIAYLADGLLCVSAHVAETVNEQLDRLSIQHRPGVEWFHPGADFFRPTHTPLGFMEKRLLKKIDTSPRPRLLVVGTLEPRKGHQQVLSALERLWRQNERVTLVFAGKEGRGVQPLIVQLKKHPQRHHRLFWCNAASDAMLCHLYQRADLLVAASLGEGFGLPLIEAAHHHLPILARDIPVFKEVAGVYARYFTTRSDARFAEDIAKWIKDWHAGRVQTAAPLTYNSWADSASQLKTALFRALLPSIRQGEMPHAKNKPASGRPAAGSGTTVL